MRTGHGTEQAERGQQSRRSRAGSVEAAEEALPSALASWDHRPAGAEDGTGDDGAGSLPRVVRTLLDALRFYAEDGKDAGEKARKAIQLHKGCKYVS